MVFGRYLLIGCLVVLFLLLMNAWIFLVVTPNKVLAHLHIV